MTTPMRKTALAMVAKGKGILAADESTGTIEKRFKSINIESTEPNRRAYRDMLFTPKGVENHISGVILYDETIRQSAKNGTAFPKLLAWRTSRVTCGSRLFRTVCRLILGAAVGWNWLRCIQRRLRDDWTAE